MKEYHETTLKLDNEFLCLMPLFSGRETTFTSCSVTVWQGYLVDNYEYYLFCREKKIPCNTHQLHFPSREHVIVWICRKQLRREGLSPRYFSYLVGKRYEAERTACGMEQGTAENISGNSYHAAAKIAKEYGLSHNTIYKYGFYARRMDIIQEKNAAIVQKILSGKLKISLENVIKLSRLPKEHIQKLNKAVSEEGLSYIGLPELSHSPRQKCVSIPGARPLLQKDIPIKQTPRFDPDAEASSLSYTVPSWTGSINRIKQTDLSIVSDTAKNRLLSRLSQLRDETDELMKILMEEHHG